MVGVRRRRLLGQSMVEIALASPLLMGLGLGVADVARAFYYQEAVNNATRQAVRYGVSANMQATYDTACSGVSTPAAVSATATVGSANSSAAAALADAAALESSSDGTVADSVIKGATLTLTFHCAAGRSITNAAALTHDPSSVSSDSIDVRISYTFSLITPYVSNMIGGNPTIVADVTGRSEY